MLHLAPSDELGADALVNAQSFPEGTDELRQWPSIERLLEAVERSPHWQAAVIVGSLATGHADAMSDVDVFILVETGAFQIAWDIDTSYTAIPSSLVGTPVPIEWHMRGTSG